MLNYDCTVLTRFEVGCRINSESRVKTVPLVANSDLVLDIIHDNVEKNRICAGPLRFHFCRQSAALE